MNSILDAVKNDRQRVLEMIVAVPQLVDETDLREAIYFAIKAKKLLLLELMITALSELCSKPGVAGGIRPLRVAVDAGAADVCQVFLKAGWDASSDLDEGMTLLHRAAKWGYLECVQKLIAADVDLDRKDTTGCTPLISAVKGCRGGAPVVEALIKAGCNVNATDNKGRTALHYCCQRGFGFNSLLKSGADTNLQDTDGNAALHLAAIEGFDVCVKFLLQNNASPVILNCFGKTPLHYLAMKGHWKGLQEMCNTGAFIDTADHEKHSALWYAVSHNRMSSVKALLRGNCNPNSLSPAQDHSDEPLTLALVKKQYQMAKLLVLGGCNVEPLYSWLEGVRDEISTTSDDSSTEDEDSDSDDEVFVEMSTSEAVRWFSYWLHSPHSLRQLTRIYIRRTMGANLRKHYGMLPIPLAIQDYVTLKEVEDIRG